MTLSTLWLILIAVLWTGYLTLEGFDFGVGMLIRLLARDERERRAMLRTIGPHWDGNEVWLLTAGGATFAAFPEWYGTLFSGAYLVLFLILLALTLGLGPDGVLLAARRAVGRGVRQPGLRHEDRGH